MFKDAANKLKLDDLFDSGWEEQRIPWGGGIELTGQCNFRCVHCYLSDDHCNDSFLDYKKMTCILDQLAESGVIYLYLTGGEIFTHPDFVDVYLYAKSKGFIIELLSNASLITDEIIELFVEYPPINISITLYGNSEETHFLVTKRSGMFSKVVNVLDKLMAAGLPFELKAPMLVETLPHLRDMTEFAKKYGCSLQYFDHIFPTFISGFLDTTHTLTNEQIVDYESRDKERSQLWQGVFGKENKRFSYLNNSSSCPLFLCNYATNTFVITNDGFIEGCNKYRLKKYNIFDMSFDDAWQALGKEKSRKVDIVDYACARCDLALACTPCPADNILFEGNELIPPQSKCDLCHLRNKYFGSEHNEEPVRI